jgi:outer membrane protein TolC
VNWTILSFWLATAWGCQKYQSQPLSLEEHRARWNNRTIDGESLRSFASELAQTPRYAAVDYDPENGISLAESEIIALFYNPDLRESRERAQVPAEAARHAMLWDDPDLSFDANRVIESVPDPWALSGSIGVSLPLSGRLGAQKRLSEAEHARALAQLAVQEWELITELRRAWLAWSAESLRAQVTSELATQIDRVVEAIDNLEGEAELPEMEARLFRLEALMRKNDARGLAGSAMQQELHLKQLLGLRPDAPVLFIPTISIEVDDLAPNQRREQVQHAHPEIIERRMAYEESERTLALEIRRQYPDVFLGTSLENDEDDQTRIGFSGSLPLAIWNRNRSAIAQARAEREARRIGFEATLETRIHELSQAEIEWQTKREVREDFEAIVFPLLEQQISDARAAVEEGDFDAFLQLETVVRFEEAKLRLIDAREQEALAATRINAALGPSLPPEPREQQ